MTASFRWIADALLAIPVVIVAVPLWLLPWRTSIAVARLCGSIAYFVWPKARRTGMMNLHRALRLDRATAATATRAVFANMAQSIAEGVQYTRRMRSGPRPEFLREENPELVRRILADPRPKIFVTGHLGSWEIAIMQAEAVAKGRGAFIARAVDNRILDALVRRIRLSSPAEWIEKRGAVDTALAHLRSGGSIAMLLDENGGRRGPFVDFFGRRASTRKTPALMSLITGAPIVVGVAVRRADPPHFLCRYALIDRSGESGSIGKRIHSITAEINATLERWITEDPLQWRWIHWRWRTRPDGSEETYTLRDLEECFAFSRSAGTEGAAG